MPRVAGATGKQQAGARVLDSCSAQTDPCPGQEVRLDCSLVGSWHRPGPPALLGLAELARLRGQAWPAVCPGLSASREGGGSCNDGEEGCCLADRERELWRPSQMSGLGLGSVLGVCVRGPGVLRVSMLP